MLRPARLAVLAGLAVVAHPALGQTGAGPPDLPATGGGTLRIAVAEAPPFVEGGADGTWDGLGIHLVREAAVMLGRDVAFVEADDVVGAVAAGRADVAVAPATAADEARADFTAPFYSARLGVARPMGSRVVDVAKRFFSTTFLKIALALSVLLFLIGVAMWAAERKQEGDDFREEKAGIWDGFWWAGVTMTTIGYGDTVPTSVVGRSLALTWMLVSMAVTASLTAGLVSALGLGGGSGTVRLPQDLRGDRVGVVEGSAAEAILTEARVAPRPYPSSEAGLRAVDADSLDAFVEAAPSLRAALSDVDLRVETTGVEFQRWAFAVAEGGALREALSRAVLDRVQSPDWPAAVDRYVSGG